MDSATLPIRMTPESSPLLDVRDLRVQFMLDEGVVRAVAACKVGERRISGWYAVGFYTASAPSTTLARSVSVTQSVRGNRVEARARAGGGINGVRAVVQVGAVCGGGS